MKSQRNLFHTSLAIWLIFSLLAIPTSIPAAAHQQMQTAATDQISGVVTDVEGQPLPDVWVEVYRGVIEGVGPWQHIGYGESTDANGLYVLRGLAPGIYRIRFSNAAYYLQCYDSAETIETATNLTVSAGMTTPDINAKLVHKGSIRGRVTDRRGNPVKNVVVGASHDPDGDGTWQSASHEFTVTDRDGNYAIEWLERGIYRVNFEAPSPYLLDEYYNDAATIEAAIDIFVDTSAVVHGIDVQLAGAVGRIAGTVRDEANQPLANVSVALYSDRDQDGHWESEGYDRSDADGSYVIGGLSDGSYWVEFTDIVRIGKYACPYPRHLQQFYDHADTTSAATAVIIEQEETRSQIDGHLASPSHIQGRVTDLDNNPIWVLVSAFDRTDPDHLECSSTYPDTQGNFDVKVYPGTYKVFFYSGAVVIPIVSYTWEYYDNAASEEAATLIAVPSRTTIMNIDAQLAPGGTIRGRVMNNAGQGVAQIRVTAYRDLTGNGYWQAVSSTVSDAAGYYGIPAVGGLEQLVYHIGFADLRTPPQYHPIIYPNVGYPEDGEDIAVDDHYEVGASDLQLLPYGSINFAPLARPDMIALLQPTPDGPWVSFGSVIANDVDTEDTPLRAELVQAPGQGAFTLGENGSFTFTPGSDPWFSETFTYRATDGVNESNLVTATFFLTTDQLFVPIIRHAN